MKVKNIKITYDAHPTTQEQLDDIFNFVFNKIAEYEAVAPSEEVSDSNNQKGEK